jgi:hypothetical protein
MMKKTLLAALFAMVVSPLFATDPHVPTDAERARWTMFDMASWRTCFFAYASDHGKYPNLKTIAEGRAAFEPIYAARLPETDAWGNPYSIESNENGFTIVSAGADGKFDRQSWATGGSLHSFDEDAVATREGRWLFRHWDVK